MTPAPSLSARPALSLPPPKPSTTLERLHLDVDVADVGGTRAGTEGGVEPERVRTGGKTGDFASSGWGGLHGRGPPGRAEHDLGVDGACVAVHGEPALDALVGDRGSER